MHFCAVLPGWLPCILTQPYSPCCSGGAQALCTRHKQISKVSRASGPTRELAASTGAGARVGQWGTLASSTTSLAGLHTQINGGPQHTAACHEPVNSLQTWLRIVQHQWMPKPPRR